MTEALTPEILKNIVKNKKFYIYSANMEGIGYSRLLKNKGINIDGFIDSRYPFGSLKMGKPIIHPDVFFMSDKFADTCVLIASKHRKFKKTAIQECEKNGLIKNQTYFIGMELCEYMPTIEVVGSCNLKCLTCPMGLHDSRSGGIMQPATYRKVLEKMTSEIHFLNSIYLFLWGEPFLHPRLNEIIDITHDFGIACEISTNLNICKNLESIIKTNPDVIAVPCSGVEKHYETTHLGGNWKTFKQNLYALRKYIDKYNAETSVKLYYHMYQHNLERDYDILRDISQELGYTFFPIIASIFPEKIFDLVVNEKPLPPEMQLASEFLIYPIEDQLKFAYENKDSFCPFKKAFPTIRWDLSVVSCTNMTKPLLFDNYLNVSLEEINKTRDSLAHCKKCMEHGIHKFFDVVNVTVNETDGKRSIIRKMQ